MRRPNLGRVICIALVVATLFVASGCGTILYPEREGQPRGQLDPGIVLLDAVGLLIFVVPGLIAFIIDFSTGAIYLPPDTPADDSGAQPAE